MALVDGGRVRVGWPGAPGCTTTGGLGSACCADTGSEKKHAKAPAAKSPTRDAVAPITDRNFLGPALKANNCIGFELTRIEPSTYHN